MGEAGNYKKRDKNWSQMNKVFFFYTHIYKWRWKNTQKNEGKQKCNIKLNIFLAPLNLMNCALKEYMVIKKKKKKRRKL